MRVAADSLVNLASTAARLARITGRLVRWHGAYGA
jgi:hypothetical protein